MVAVLPRNAERLYSDDALPDELGWIAWLTPSHQRLLLGELYAAWKGGSTEAELAELLDAWQATAELDQDHEARERLEQNRKSTRWASVDEWMQAKGRTA